MSELANQLCDSAGWPYSAQKHGTGKRTPVLAHLGRIWYTSHSMARGGLPGYQEPLEPTLAAGPA
jgi:hypothetical protein